MRVPASIAFRRTLAKVRRFRFTRKTVDDIIGVFGELLMTAGVLVLLFLGWHVWYNDIVSGIVQNRAGAALTEEWARIPTSVPEFDRSKGSSDGVALVAEPPIEVAPREQGTRFATLIVPRFGESYERAIAVGTDRELVLNVRDAGIGAYMQSDALGQIGNFSIAAHRITYGAPFADIEKLRLGDRIYIETRRGWYVYRYRNLEYVWPNEVSVLNQVPRSKKTAEDRILTLTSCHPPLTSVERIIAYAVFDTFVPRENGAPVEVTKVKESR